jgi:4-aminobutyrate aminotransferase-like enzyme
MTPQTLEAPASSMQRGLPLLARHPAVQAAIDSIIAELERAQAGITGARPADPVRAAEVAAWVERNRAVRGNATFYPYVGDGFGHGPLVQLADGSVKWDMINGIGVHMFGHSDPRMVRAALEAGLSDLCQEGNLQFNADVLAVAELLVAEAARTSGIRHCFITNSGCMANESALKVCQQKTGGAPRIIAFADCFMGRSTTMSQIGDGPAYRQGVALNILVDYMPFYDPSLGQRSIDMAAWHLRQTIARYPKQHSCFVVEPVQGEGGFNTAPPEFFRTLMGICRDAGIPVWADEVQSFGRTERMFHFEALGVGDLVDVVTIGKMSQVCACLMTPEMNPKPGLLSGTFSSSVSAYHVGLRALEIMRDGGYYGPSGRNAMLHAAFREHAERLVKANPACFPQVLDSHGRAQPSLYGGTGGMMRLTPFGGDKDRIVKLLHAMYAEGVMAFYCGHGPYHIRFLAPVGVMEPQHMGPVFEIIERSLRKVA